MKKILLAGLALILSQLNVNGQTFKTVADTMNFTVNNTGGVVNNITNNTASGGIIIKWRVIASDFPADWRTSDALGICDNNTCWYNFGDTTLWNGSTGQYHRSAPYSYNASELFDLVLNFTPSSLGTHYMTVALTDTAGNYTKNVTFIVTKKPAGINNINTPDDKVSLYPNPARDEINVVYDATADVKNIAVYNIIGKMMMVYKVNGGSANMNIGNLPSGIYFAKLYNSNGSVISTQKFSKQ